MDNVQLKIEFIYFVFLIFLINFCFILLHPLNFKVLLRLIRPYIRIKLSYLAEELKIPQAEVVRLLVEIIHDKCKQLRIDQLNETVIRIGYGQDLLHSGGARAMEKVCNELETLTRGLMEKCL